jgi:2-dehydropantoate 2-reductase
MRFVIYGAGAVGGTIGARLFQAGHDVTLIARGDHLRALQDKGLTLATPAGTDTLPIPAVGDPAEADLAPGDVVLLAMKSQQTAPAVAALAAAAPPAIAVVCAQNGVNNERVALRTFADVYGMTVMLPATHLEPGVVVSNSAGKTGLLDIGRYPEGVDEVASSVAEALSGATFDSVPRPDIMRWKYRKLLMNLGNAVEATCGPAGRTSALMGRVVAEGEAVLAAAGLSPVTSEEDRARRGDLLSLKPVDGRRREGGSTTQSLLRGLPTVESDYLNGEIVLLGRLHGVAAPANAVVQRLAAVAAATGAGPGGHDPDEVLALVDGGA